MDSYKLITAILPNHQSKDIIKALKTEKGIIMADRSHSRGSKVGSNDVKEMEILTVVVKDSEAENVFQYIYNKAELFNPHTGIMYQQALKKSTKYSLPKDIKEED